MTAALDSIVPPLSAEVQGRCWYTRGAGVAVDYGCCSHSGPPLGAAEKENEDFAFAIERTVRDESWLLIGVADGVSNSTWAERAAQHAAASFLEVVGELLEHTERLEAQLRERAFRHDRFSEPLCRRLLARLEGDVAAIVASGLAHPSWEPDLYRSSFLEGTQAATNRHSWLQTTLLAGALGPRGGFALLLGDGFVAVDRVGAGARRRTGGDLVPVGASATPVVSRWLRPGEVDDAFRNVAPMGAEELMLLLATDGVSRTPDNGLDGFIPVDGACCRQLIERLAGRPRGQVELDNMSVAFGRCRVQP